MAVGERHPATDTRSVIDIAEIVARRALAFPCPSGLNAPPATALS